MYSSQLFRRPSTSSIRLSENDDKTASKSVLFAKEEEYRRMNAELEKKTSELMNRFEQFSKGRDMRFTGKIKKIENGSGDYFDDSEEISSRTSIKEIKRDVNDEDYKLDYGLGQPMKSVKSNTKQRSTDHLPTNQKSCIELSSYFESSRSDSPCQRATDSIVRNLQSKLVNQDERLTELHFQHRQTIQENTILQGRIKSLEDEKDKLARIINSLHGTVEKHAKFAHDSKSNLNVREATVGSLKKEIDELKREVRTEQSQAQNCQSRLHRVIEENEKLKGQNKSLSQQIRELTWESRKKLDSASQKLTEVERQRNLLQSTVLKQTQAIEKMKKRVGSIRGSRSTSAHNRHFGSSSILDDDDAKSCYSSF